MEDFIDYIEENTIRNVIILSGAGISTNAGIPDYRSSGGSFSTLTENPQNILSRSSTNKVMRDEYLRTLEEKMDLVEPTKSHLLGKILNDMGILKRIYTQNIDSLYQKAGVPDDKIVEFHGSFKKDNVVLYGDSIKKEVLEYVEKDLIRDVEDVDLLIVMGTSLQVAPFCALPNMVLKDCCRVLVDICPQNAFKNPFSKVEITPYSFYGSGGVTSYIKFGKHKVTLRPHWSRNKRWKNQFIIKEDCDIFTDEFEKGLNQQS